MTPQQLVGIGIRLFAIWLAITSIAYFVSIPAALSAGVPNSGSTVALAYALGTGYVVGALLLWFFPMLVAHKLLPRTQYENRLSFQAHDLARVGCSLLGIWVFAKALPSLIWFLFRSFITVDAGSSFSALSPDTKLELAVATFELVFAVALIVKSGAFASIVVPRTPSHSASAGDL